MTIKELTCREGQTVFVREYDNLVVSTLIAIYLPGHGLLSGYVTVNVGGIDEDHFPSYIKY